MIFVMLGTQKEPFTRLLDYVNSCDTKQKVVAQIGHTQYHSDRMQLVDFISQEQLEDYIEKADIIITHGGTGSILTALKRGKKVIACARLKKYDEHVDNHQKELVRLFREKKYLLELDDKTSLNDLLVKIDDFVPRPYIGNTAEFINRIVIEIEN